jgi:hypothetical protein
LSAPSPAAVRQRAALRCPSLCIASDPSAQCRAWSRLGLAWSAASLPSLALAAARRPLPQRPEQAVRPRGLAPTIESVPIGCKTATPHERKARSFAAAHSFLRTRRGVCGACCVLRVGVGVLHFAFAASGGWQWLLPQLRRRSGCCRGICSSSRPTVCTTTSHGTSVEITLCQLLDGFKQQTWVNCRFPLRPSLAAAVGRSPRPSRYNTRRTTWPRAVPTRLRRAETRRDSRRVRRSRRSRGRQTDRRGVLFARPGSALPHLHRDWGSPLAHLHRDWGDRRGVLFCSSGVGPLR